jgi:helix-turn-helix protein
MQLLGTADIAALIGIDPRTVIRLFKSGEIRAFKAGPKLWRTTRPVYEQWVKDKLEPDRVNALTAPTLPMPVLFRDRKRAAIPRALQR